MTDEWRSYSSIENWGNYKHLKINHSENFVQPENKEVHTQNIESLWRKLKRRQRRICYIRNIFENILQILHGGKNLEMIVFIIFGVKFQMTHVIFEK